MVTKILSLEYIINTCQIAFNDLKKKFKESQGLKESERPTIDEFINK